ncbi:DUF6624 domain-containing protein [Brevundimonas sp. NPDC092305]|uniref:DUF6624 domain-containing protein n=1 Tax=Brevundimonas sp. NPDC092305 TaxID=3363957 RepID=UPI0038291CC6
MIALLVAAVLAFQAPAPLSPEAQALIAPVAEAIAAEEARQAALPPATSDRERLERMGVLDQVGRRTLTPIDLGVLPEAERQAAIAVMWAPVMAMDDRLLAELLPMVPEEGWFRKSVYGEQASKAAFLIIQHSDLEQWRRFVPILEPLVEAGEVDGQSYGLMYDRLAINERRPQRYGTQVICKGGKLVIDWENLEDPANADARRRAMGFQWTLAEYEAVFADYPPCDKN